ncbi:fibropellin-3-like [Panicum miliaceum]|uniref:Fibropellin-3-like n=1 Tax=Panicum miliaceum TaxID=4540 RepID=A0A3L6SA17_PANMI|nr:fibropellin-3-like [Panicum miliaceum]
MSALARSSTASEPVRLLLLTTLLASCAAGASVCDTANCGKGACMELPKLIPGVPNYECHCDPGWSKTWKAIPFSPCVIPNCSFDGACFNISLTPPPPKPGLPTDVCAAVSCGPGGACKAGDAPFSYSCECQPGYANLLDLAALPCVNNCFFGKGCSALGLAPAPAPSSPSSPTPPSPAAPTGSHDSSGPSAPPSGTEGNSTATDSFFMHALARRVETTLAQ